MAYTVVDYGEQTPQTLDRFGTEQECLVWGRNGDRHFHHHVVPQRSSWSRRALKRLQRVARREEDRFTWEGTNVPGTMLYHVRLNSGRVVTITDSADGRVAVRVDHQHVYRETNRMRNGQRERAVTQLQSQEAYERELAQEERREALRAKLGTDIIHSPTQEHHDQDPRHDR
ncbi:hypothetical protein PLEIONE_70 [Mycobacterium phage Pleione]|uniref:Uncharacterized protein n=7 Tax=Bixzunavirus Bxz1 TaxID=2006134 RepID=B5LK56_9CAUD|nr:gp65 [Mycobacterium phage Rizal]YP_009017404.1 hypothetical protein MOMOMIXON_68 [Mycobacterium phage MoMoMixon]YP_009017844.1 hypothetical protein PLEIONE_70 [Mycobacterium phage Pleione]AER25435.1 hypothetical protein WALLY_66 [Mycobacterium phage Wally]AGV99788.1 hypothetical protein PBI_SHRIMP_68 [Mycobacterium phage Shrimp]AID18148.1 hypothetical protein PBI_WILLIS_68 [Mycobacterium phage Willis]AIX12748.1 hypothetical protein PBI_ZYGOTAIGA_67 [Mycobacterium phage ZygoTaiga]AOZ62948.